MKLKSLMLIFASILLSVGISGCQESNRVEVHDTNESKSKIEASDFVLEITTPAVVEKGSTLKVNGTLTYKGNDTINLFHGGPVVRFTFTGSNETHTFTDIGLSTELKPGENIEVEDEFYVWKKGKQSLSARTTILEVNGELIEGVGNEKYIKENMNERALEIEKSKITIEPIEIIVK